MMYSMASSSVIQSGTLVSIIRGSPFAVADGLALGAGGDRDDLAGRIQPLHCRSTAALMPVH
jgi:hypothetical protein